MDEIHDGIDRATRLVPKPVRSFFNEFREFAVKGNVVDLAVGVIIGTAFGALVTSLTTNVLTPPLGYVIGHVQFENLTWTLLAETPERQAVAIRYGQFIDDCISFLIKAFAMFLVIRVMNRVIRQKEEAAKQPSTEQSPPLSTQERLLTEIRDELRGNVA
jgi:large conductance mechanosensitive channel